MRGPKPPPIVLTAAQRDTLQRLARRQRSPQQLVRRVRIILEAASGANNAQIARLLGIDRGQVRTRRKRWLEAAPRLITAAEEEAKEKKEAGDDESSSSHILHLSTRTSMPCLRNKAPRSSISVSSPSITVPASVSSRIVRAASAHRGSPSPPRLRCPQCANT